jgi:serine/threonine-protein kinase
MAAVVARHIHAPIPDIGIVRPAITPSLQHVLEVALAKTPVDRFASVAAFAEALTAEYAIPSRVTRAGAAAAAAKRTFAMRWVAIGGVAAASVAAAVWFGLGWFSTRTEADPNLMLVAPFNVIDREGDLDVWREGVVDIVSRNLHGAGALRTVSPTLVVRQIRGTSDQASVEAAARALRAGFGVYGTLTRRGADSVRIQASAIRIGDTAPGHNIEIVGRADQMDQLCDSLTVQLLDVVRAQGIDGAGRPAMVHSSSIAALRDFLRGEQLVRRALYDSATYYFQRASELDSTFALAFQRRYHVRLHQGDGESPEDFALALRAGELNRGLSPRDSFTVVIDSIQAAIALRDYASDSLGQSMRQRLFRTLDAATSRFAGDAEIWFRVGFARNLLQQGDFTPDAILEPFDLSIDLDSTFLPPYRYAIELAMVTKGSAEGRRHIEAYLRQNPPGVNGDGMRLALRLMNAERQSEREIDGWIAAAPAPVAFAAFQALFWWPDSGETAIRVARRIANDAAGRAELAPTNEQWGRILLSVAQAWRGRMRQAVATWGAVDSLHKYFQALSAQLATLGGIPPAEVDRLNHAALAGPEGLRELRPHQLSYWATRKDTAALETILRLVRAAPTTPGAMVSPARLRYLSDGAAAYLALIRQDSAAASDLLAKLQPDDCPPCDLDRLERARLEAGRGRMAVADSILRHDAVRNTEPAGVLWRLERARAARRRGDRETAAREYGFVAEVWRNADAPLQPYVREAREALQALGN